jgi:nucleoside-diphosphate-sugar epimerase
MLAFVTGSTGFIGLNLIDQLTAAGWDVVALHRQTSDLTYLQRFDVRRVVGDISDIGAVERAIPERVDAVFHTAADLSSWSRNNDRQTRTNVLGTRNVVAAALKRGAKKFVHTSTSSVYGFVSTPVDETAPHLGRGSWFNYMHTKTVAEDEVRKGIERGLDAVILNPTHVIGRYDRHNWSRLIQLAAKGELPRIPPGSGSFCHGGEAARAHIAAVTKGHKGENYLLAGTDATFQEVVATAGQLLGRRVETRTVSAPILRMSAAVLNLVSHFTGKEPLITPEGAALVTINETFRSDKATQTLDYRPVPLREMVKDCCDWLVEEGLLERVLSTENPCSRGGR